MGKQKPNDIFDRLHPGDGFRVRRVAVGRGVSLHIGIWQGGELSNPFGAAPEDATVEILEHKDATAADLGQTTRLELLLDAVCRYFTTGGDWDELYSALSTARKVMAGGLTYPGYELLDSYSDTDGNYEHIFVRTNTNQAVLWVEDEFIDRKTLEQIRHEQESDWEGDIVDDASGDADDLPQLLHPRGLSDEGEADCGPDAAEEPPAAP